MAAAFRESGSSNSVLGELEYLSDMVLISGDGVKINVHRVFLAKYSGFFRELFASGCSSSREQNAEISQSTRVESGSVPDKIELRLPEVSSEALRALVSLVYCTAGKKTCTYISAYPPYAQTRPIPSV